MADTLVKNPKLIVGTQAQVEAEIGVNDIGFATDIRFYNATETDTLLASKQPVGDYATNSALASGLALKVAIAQGAENAGKILKIDDSGNVIVADESGGGASLPILYHTWSDHVINGMSWLRADTFSWQSGDVYKAAYEHLANDLESPVITVLSMQNWYKYGNVAGTHYYTKSSEPLVGDKVYTLSDGKLTEYGAITSINPSDEIGYAIRVGDSETPLYHWAVSDVNIIVQTDTIGDIKIEYYLAEDGHKICLPDQEAALMSLYGKSGAADYYMLDTTNKQFKLPRKQKRKLIQAYKNGDTWYNLYSDGWIEQGGIADVGANSQYNGVFPQPFKDTNISFFATDNTSALSGGQWGTQQGCGASSATNFYLRTSNDGTTKYSWLAYGYAAESVYTNASMRLEYYYVGGFAQEAIEQTAGVTTETLNGKVDTDLGNITSTGKETVVSWGMPDYSAGVSITQGQEYTAPCDLLAFGKSTMTSDSRVQVFINGVMVVGVTSASYNNEVCTCALVPKGATFKVINNHPEQTAYFPLKGAN